MARNGPGDSSSGPLVTDRHPAENPGEKFTRNGTPVPRQRTTRRAVVVTGVVELDLSRHVDRCGGIYDDARTAVHRGLSTLPPGAGVRVRLGRARWVSGSVLDLLAEYLLDAGSVEVVGTDDCGPSHVVPRLRERLEVAA